MPSQGRSKAPKRTATALGKRVLGGAGSGGERSSKRTCIGSVHEHAGENDDDMLGETDEEYGSVNGRLTRRTSNKSPSPTVQRGDEATKRAVASICQILANVENNNRGFPDRDDQRAILLSIRVVKKNTPILLGLPDPNHTDRDETELAIFSSLFDVVDVELINWLYHRGLEAIKKPVAGQFIFQKLCSQQPWPEETWVNGTNETVWHV